MNHPAVWRCGAARLAPPLLALLLVAGCSAPEPEDEPPAVEPAAQSSAPAEAAPIAASTPPIEPAEPAEPLPTAKVSEPSAVPVTEHTPTDERAQRAKAEPAAETDHAIAEPAETPYHKPNEKTATDPVQQNGPIFVDWPKPEAALLISGEQIGFIEPCGCAGLDNQKGGLKRRHTLLDSLREQGWPVVPIDLGGQVRRFGRQAEIKYRRTIGALAEIGYEAIGFGPQELRLPAEHVLSVAANLAAGERGAKPFVSANVGILDFDLGYVERYRVLEAGGRTIGVTSILGEQYQATINNDDVLFIEPEKALAEIVGPLAEQADFLVLLSHATAEESKALARKFPQFDVVVTAGGAEEPPRQAEKIEGTETLLVEVGHKGMYVAVLGLYDDPQQPVRYQRVPLDARFADSPDMQQMLVEYQRELETLGLTGLDVKTQLHPTGNTFVGSHACADCHTQAYEVWKNSPHAHATQTLVDLEPPRHFDPECLSCHVTGWNPQNYFPYSGGYTDLEKTALLRTNGCENCHGPGSAHVAAELGDVEADDALLEKLRAQMRLKLQEGEAEGQVVGAVTAKCVECHDLDNSPDFDFKTYWPEVEHHGLD